MKAAQGLRPRPRVDWTALRRRMDAAREAIAGRDETPEAARAVLEARARELAKPPRERAAEERVELVTFSLAGDRYAIESRHVLEVFRVRHVTALGSAAAPLAGITAWRGELLPVLDLARETDASGRRRAHALVLGDGAAAIGILADAVEGLASLPAPELRRPEGRFWGDLRIVTGGAVRVLDGSELIRTYGGKDDG